MSEIICGFPQERLILYSTWTPRKVGLRLTALESNKMHQNGIMEFHAELPVTTTTTTATTTTAVTTTTAATTTSSATTTATTATATTDNATTAATTTVTTTASGGNNTTTSSAVTSITIITTTPPIEPECGGCSELCCDYCDDGTKQCADPVCGFCYLGKFCGRCNICKSGQPPIVGYVLGNDYVSVVDALEILKYVLRLNSVIDKCDNAFDAAMIVSVPPLIPGIPDTLEILKFIVGLESVIV